MAVNPVGQTDNAISYTRDLSNDKTNSSVDTLTFLKLFVAQLKYQDPLSPQDNTAFVSQLAQMSSMESMTNMNATLKNSQAYDMIDKEIYAEVLDKTTGETVGYNGIVSSIVIKQGVPYAVLVDAVVIKDGNPYASSGSTAINLSDIIQVFNQITEDDSAAIDGEDGTEDTSTADT